MLGPDGQSSKLPKLFWVFCLLGALESATSHAKELLYVEAGKDIHVIDATSFEEIAKIPVGIPIDDVVGSPDGRMAYGNAWLPSGNPVGRPDTGAVYAISTATNKIVWWAAIPGLPEHLTVSSDGTRLFVPALDRNYIFVVDTASGRIVDQWFSTLGNHGTELSPDGRRLYVGNMFDRGILVYDIATGRVVNTVHTREGVRPFKVDRDEKRVYYQLSNYHGFEVKDIATDQIVKIVDLPKLPPDAKPGEKNTLDHGLAIPPDQSMIIAAASPAGYVAVYRLPDLTLLKTIPVGTDSNWIRVRADSNVAFISNRASGDISVLDLKKLTEIKRIPVGKGVARFSIVDVPQ